MKPQLFNFNQKPVRFVIIDNQKYAVGKDSALAIGYKDPQRAVRTHVKDKYKRVGRIALPQGGNQEVVLISEPGLYQLAAQSKLPDAEPFQDWLFEEVLPQINKDGAYVSERTAEEWLDDPDAMIRVLKRYKDVKAANEKIQIQNKQLIEQHKKDKPLVDLAKAITNSEGNIDIGLLATFMYQAGINCGRNTLFSWLRRDGYLINQSGRKNTPTSKSMKLGLFEVIVIPVKIHGKTVNKSKTVATHKAIDYFIRKYAPHDVVEQLEIKLAE